MSNAVQVRDEHEVDARRIDPRTLEPLQDRRTTVDEERRRGRLDEIGAVQASARAERIAGAEDSDTDDAVSHAYPRVALVQRRTPVSTERRRSRAGRAPTAEQDAAC